MKLIKEFKLGSDPELFLIRKDTGEYFPAIGLIEGTKKKPLPMDNLAKGFAWQIDNCSLEYNIPPASTKNEWINYHKTALNYIKCNIDTHLFKLALDASAEFNWEYLEMPGAKEAGCETDNNAWQKRPNPKVSVENTNLRVCGGHVSIGFAEAKDMLLCEQLIRAMDIFLGLPSVLLDDDTKRRQLYGKAGSFRFSKTFTGVEYRTLSNFWINSEQLMGYVWDNTELAIKFISEGNTLDDDLAVDVELAINESIPELAQDLMERYNVPIIKELIKVKI